MKEKRNCKFCGKEFVPKIKTMNCCGSEECLKIRYKVNAQALRDKKKAEKIEKANAKNQLSILSDAADRAGMSYGKYVALHGL